MKNEWDLLVLVREQLAAGEPIMRFAVLEPPLWSLFSHLTAQVKGADDGLYELSSDFPTVLHEFIKWQIRCRLQVAPSFFQLSFQPDLKHPQYVDHGADISAPPETSAPSRTFRAPSPDASHRPPAPGPGDDAT